MQKLKRLIKPILRPLTPRFVLESLHYAEADYAALRSKRPSREMIVIGIVGSKGKTSTANMLWAALSADGTKVGQIGTANIRVGEHEELNKYHMTLPNPLIIQPILRRMADAGCKYVVLEVPSEAQTQFRHVGINFDVLVFTNVTREIMAAHRNSMEVLHQHNKRVFMQMAKSKHKVIDGKRVPKMIISNADASDTPAYSSFKADQKISYSVKSTSDYHAIGIKATDKGVDFSINGHPYHLSLLGTVNVINAAGAIATAFALGKDAKHISDGLTGLKVIPGRMEVIDEGQNFTVIVDYAHEQVSMQALMDSAAAMKVKGAKVITLVGAEGGGRDVEKRPAMGEIVAKGSDYTIICNVDPYDDRPMEIIEDIAKGAEAAGAKINKDLFCIEDRREAIAKGLSLAKKGDIVLITGKGSEQSMVIGGKKLPWDDRDVVREALKRRDDKQVKTRAGVIILDKENVLLIHRWYMGREYYVVPGGSAEKGESVQEAAIREAKEETNLNVVLGKKLLEFTLEDDGYGVSQKNTYFLVKSYSGKAEFGLSGPEADKQSDTNRYELEWVPLKRVSKLNLRPEEIKRVIEKL